MDIKDVLIRAKNETEPGRLEMILGNRIDMGSEAGGLISSKQIPTLVEDLLVWKKEGTIPMPDGDATSPQYLAVWGVGYSGVHRVAKVETVPVEYICTSNGYSTKDCLIIRQLEIGESHEMLDCGYHTVVRLS